MDLIGRTDIHLGSGVAAGLVVPGIFGKILQNAQSFSPLFDSGIGIDRIRDPEHFVVFAVQSGGLGNGTEVAQAVGDIGAFSCLL